MHLELLKKKQYEYIVGNLLDTKVSMQLIQVRFREKEEDYLHFDLEEQVLEKRIYV